MSTTTPRTRSTLIAWPSPVARPKRRGGPSEVVRGVAHSAVASASESPSAASPAASPATRLRARPRSSRRGSPAVRARPRGPLSSAGHRRTGRAGVMTRKFSSGRGVTRSCPVPCCTPETPPSSRHKSHAGPGRARAGASSSPSTPGPRRRTKPSTRPHRPSRSRSSAPRCSARSATRSSDRSSISSGPRRTCSCRVGGRPSSPSRREARTPLGHQPSRGAARKNRRLVSPPMVSQRVGPACCRRFGRVVRRIR